MDQVIYEVDVPYDMKGERIQAFWSDSEQCFEWRVVMGAVVVKGASRLGYGSPEIALRDALIELSK